MEKKPEIDELHCIYHFGHHHQLYLTGDLTSAACSVCELKSDGLMYSCSHCNFAVHTDCAKLPHCLNHPSHPHPLTLINIQTNSYSSFNCDACKDRGRGFDYRCSHCDFHLHIPCAVTPSSITHQAHPLHQLKLAFEVPSSSNAFSCNICGQIGSKQWVYRCDSCRFDAHLKCAMGWTRSTTTTTAEAATSSTRSEIKKFVKGAAVIAREVAVIAMQATVNTIVPVVVNYFVPI